MGSPFARSVASHVRALQDGGCSRELFSKYDADWESSFERSMVDEKERRRQSKLEKLKYFHSSHHYSNVGDGNSAGVSEDDATKRFLRTRVVQQQPLLSIANQEKVM